MPFYCPPQFPKLPHEPPSDVSIPDFILKDENRIEPLNQRASLFQCGLSGKSYTPSQASERVDLLARALHRDLGWEVNKGSEWDKVVGVFAVNTVCAPLYLNGLPLAYTNEHRLD